MRRAVHLFGAALLLLAQKKGTGGGFQQIPPPVYRVATVVGCLLEKEGHPMTGDVERMPAVGPQWAAPPPSRQFLSRER
jgi:hypothetical protein